MSALDFSRLNETQFEDFSFELLGLLGFKNVDWRKGTPKASSPADRGRDIEADLPVTEVDGTLRLEHWFVECKHYSKGVPPDALTGALAWATSQRPDVLLIMASGYLSNGCKDHLADFRTNNRPPFRIKEWEGTELDQLAGQFPSLLDKYDLGGRRSTDEVIAAEQEHADRLTWIEYSQWLYDNPPDPDREADEADEALRATIEDEMSRMRESYGEEFPEDLGDRNLGLLLGRLSALRWTLGSDWDEYDT